MYATPEVKTNIPKDTFCDIPPPVPPPLLDDDDTPPVPVYRGDMDIPPSTVEYSEVALDRQIHVCMLSLVLMQQYPVYLFLSIATPYHPWPHN